MALINALPPFNIIKNFADSPLNPQKIISKNIQSSKESIKIGLGAAAIVGAASNPKATFNLIKKAPDIAKQSAIIGGTALGGLAAYGLISRSKKPAQLLSQAPQTALDVGGLGADILESKSWEERYGHLRNFVQEHPVASGIGAGLLTIGAGKLVSGGLGYLQSQRVAEQTEAIREQTGAILEATKGIGQQQQVAPLTSTGIMQEQPTGTSWVTNQGTTTRSITKRRAKPKNINTRPINIRNYNVMAVKNG